MDHLEVYCLTSKYLGILPTTSLLLISSFILFWPENILCRICILPNVLRMVLSPRIWSVAVTFPCISEKTMFSALVKTVCSINVNLIGGSAQCEIANSHSGFVVSVLSVFASCILTLWLLDMHLGLLCMIGEFTLFHCMKSLFIHDNLPCSEVSVIKVNMIVAALISVNRYFRQCSPWKQKLFEVQEHTSY